MAESEISEIAGTHPIPGTGGAKRVSDSSKKQIWWPKVRVCPICMHNSVVEWRAFQRKLYSTGKPYWDDSQADYDPWGTAFVAGYCLACGKFSLHTKHGELLWPDELDVPPANLDMPLEVQEHYNQARRVAGQSPRAAITLLRYCIDTLLSKAGYTGTLQSKIAEFSKAGGSRRLKRALEVIQNVGNSAAHSGEIIWDIEHLDKLFTLVNHIGDELHSKDTTIEDAYRSMQQRRAQQR